MLKLKVFAPWMVVGDFNNVLTVTKRVGVNTPMIQEMQPFDECLESCGLEDMRSRGRVYTWSFNTIS